MAKKRFHSQKGVTVHAPVYVHFVWWVWVTLDRCLEHQRMRRCIRYDRCLSTLSSRTQPRGSHCPPSLIVGKHGIFWQGRTATMSCVLYAKINESVKKRWAIISTKLSGRSPSKWCALLQEHNLSPETIFIVRLFGFLKYVFCKPPGVWGNKNNYLSCHGNGNEGS